MDNLRSSVVAAERLVRTSARPSVEVPAGSQAFPKYGYIAIATIAVLTATSILLWRALTAERAQRVAAETSLARNSSSANTLRRIAAETAFQRAINRTVVGVLTSPPVTPTLQNGLGSAAVALNGAEFVHRLTDPAAHEALRAQQKGVVLQLYGELLRRWHLTGASAGPILDALADHELQQLVGALASGAAGNNAAGGNAADNDAVRAALNTKLLDELRVFDNTLADRMSIQPLLSELELSQTPLPADKAEQLIEAMHDERIAIPQPQPPTDSQATSAYLQSLNDWQANLDKRVLDRAGTFLPGDFVSRLESFQIAQRTASSVFASVQPIAAPSSGATSQP